MLLSRQDVFQPNNLGNEWQSKTWVAVEPELEWHIERRRLSVVETSARERNGVADHVVITNLVTGRLRELVPDVEPIAVLLVDALTADFNIDVADERMTEVIHPTEAVRNRSRARNGWDRHLEVDTVDEVTVTRDRASHTLAEVGLTVESLLDRLDREVRVTTIDHLPESDLWITSEVNILSAISDELHKTATTHVCCLFLKGKERFYS